LTPTTITRSGERVKGTPRGVRLSPGALRKIRLELDEKERRALQMLRYIALMRARHPELLEGADA